MKSKPLMFIDSPNSLNKSNKKSQYSFDSRFDSLRSSKKFKSSKLDNIILMNKKGKKILCKFILNNKFLEGFPIGIYNNILNFDSNGQINKIDLMDLLDVEIIKI